MLELDPHARLYLAFALGVGAALAGAGNALFAFRFRGQVLLALAGVAAAAGAAAAFDPALAKVAAVVGAVLVAGWLAVRTCGGLFRSPRVRWAGLAAVGVAAVAYEAYRFEAAEQARADRDLAQMAEMAYRPVTAPVTGLAVTTDSGAAVAVEAAQQQRPDYELRAADEAMLAAFPLRDQVIRRAQANDRCNCHGWVFTGGRYVVRGGDVDRILADNRYAAAADPRPGDVCVYRGDANAVSHTAVVRAVCPDGTVLVEGKWGWLGVFLHPAESSCYGTKYSFYRSGRPTHLLAGMTPPAAAAPAAAE